LVTEREVKPIPRSKDSIRAFRALGQETRFRILDLVSSNVHSVKELEERLGISQSAVSQQLKILHEAGLVRLRREGKYTLCSINHSPLEEVRNLLNRLLDRRHMFSM
ncbi:MAG: metalloregulator ArsR/SmtB family transcription factor, partial [Bacillota bacterium]|jgi:DNA-binding transcriptional ArsR family regulator